MRFTSRMSTIRLPLVLACVVMSATVASASPYYTVQQVSDNYRLPQSPTPSLYVDPKTLPLVSYDEGVINTTQEHAPVRVVDVNSQGTIIGAFPDGESRAIPWISLDYAYSTKQADGSYSELHFLGDNSLRFFLDDRNEILLLNYQQLVNANVNSYAQIADLISPSDLAKYNGLSAIGLGDDGSILATYYSENKTHEVLLIPPTTLESPVPEPSTLLLFGVVTFALALRQKARARRACTACQRSFGGRK